jgi:hypothetical protein
MHSLVRSQERDPSWAPAIEAALRNRYARIPHLGPGGAPRVTCATLICEVAGYIDLPEPKMDEKATEAANEVMNALQIGTVHDDVVKFGLKSEGALFTASVAPPKRPVFFIYWSRVKS